MFLRRVLHFIPILLLAICMAGCDLPPTNTITTGDIDPAGGLTRDDYLALRHRERLPPATNDDEVPAAPGARAVNPASGVPPIPAMPTTGGASRAGFASGDVGEEDDILDRRVSVNVSEGVPVRDVLLELAHKADANLELDPRVSGNVIISARDQPFGEVLRRICELTGLRYSVEGSFIHIVPDRRRTPADRDATPAILAVDSDRVTLRIAGEDGAEDRTIVLHAGESYQLADGTIRRLQRADR